MRLDVEMEGRKMPVSQLRIILLTVLLFGLGPLVRSGGSAPQEPKIQIGREVSIPEHLQDDDEFKLPLKDLFAYGSGLFSAAWTEEEGGGRPQTKGTGRGLSDPNQPLIGLRSFN